MINNFLLIACLTFCPFFVKAQVRVTDTLFINFMERKIDKLVKDSPCDKPQFRKDLNHHDLWGIVKIIVANNYGKKVAKRHKYYEYYDNGTIVFFMLEWRNPKRIGIHERRSGGLWVIINKSNLNVLLISLEK